MRRWNLAVLLACVAMLSLLSGCGGGGGGGGGGASNPSPPPSSSTLIANPGASRTVATGGTVTLDGSGSSDGTSHALTYSWSFLSKPGGSAATLSSATAVAPTFVADVAGPYVLQLIVNNGTADSAPKTVTVAAITPIDVWQVFPDNQGDNNFTASGYVPATATETPLADVGTFQFKRFNAGTSSYTNPLVFKSLANDGWAGDGWVGLVASTSESAALAWKIPNAGSYRLTGSFKAFAASVRNVQTSIMVNNTEVLTYSLVPGTAQTFDITVQAGPLDTLYFLAKSANEGDAAFVSCSIQAGTP